jgi:PAS domain S-box-containing protein
MQTTFNSDKENCFQLLEVNQQAMLSAEAEAKDNANRAILSVIIASIIAILISIAFNWQFSKIIIEPIKNLTENVRQIGAGRLDLKININTRDEIGQLSEEFNKMTERLRHYEAMNIDQIIAEKKKSESIVKSISDAIIVTDDINRIILLNQSAEELFEIKEHNVIGKYFNEVVTEMDVYKKIDFIIKSNEKSELKISDITLLKRNLKRFFRLHINPVKSEAGKLIGTIILFHDITPFKELDKLKSDFVATVSHEFRTPLTSIGMSIDMLIEGIPGDLTEKQLELIVSAKEDYERLTKLVKELLELSKLEAGQIQFQKEKLEISELVNFAIKPMLLPFYEKDVQLIFNSQNKKFFIIGDHDRLSWVITNLVSNALKYTEPGGKVEIDINQNDGNINVSVMDTGIGIPKEHLSSVFDKFVQIKHSVDSNSPGSVGLGLTIAKEIVQAHSGKIWAESPVTNSEENLPVGSRFTFSLPICEV